MTCPVCGFQFKEYKYVCEGCIFHSGCELICCPNCHYQFPVESKLVNMVSKLFGKNTKNESKRN